MATLDEFIESLLEEKRQRIAKKMNDRLKSNIMNTGVDVNDLVNSGVNPELNLGTKNALLKGGISNNYHQEFDKNGNINYVDDYGNKCNEKANLWKVVKGKAEALKNNVEIYANETNPESDIYKQKTNAMLGILTSPLGAGNMATQYVAGKLAPIVGKKIAHITAQGIGGGLVGGALEGAGRGIIEGENPIKTSAIDAGVGAISGGVGGLGLGKLGQYGAANYIRKADVSEDVLRDKAEQYFKDYLHDLNIKRKDLGDITFTGKFKKLINSSADTRKLRTIPDLSKLIKNDYLEGSKDGYTKIIKKIINGVEKEVERKPKFQKYHYLTGENNILGEPYQHRITIGEDANGKRFYNINDIDYFPPKYNDAIPPLDSQSQGANNTATNIITDYNKNLKFLEQKGLKNVNDRAGNNSKIFDFYQELLKMLKR